MNCTFALSMWQLIHNCTIFLLNFPVPIVRRSCDEASERALKIYLDAVRSLVAVFAFGGSDDDLVSGENGQVVANLATTTQHAYDTLHENNYMLGKALVAVRDRPLVSNVRLLSLFTTESWPCLRIGLIRFEMISESDLGWSEASWW